MPWPCEPQPRSGTQSTVWRAAEGGARVRREHGLGSTGADKPLTSRCVLPVLRSGPGREEKDDQESHEGLRGCGDHIWQLGLCSVQVQVPPPTWGRTPGWPVLAVQAAWKGGSWSRWLLTAQVRCPGQVGCIDPLPCLALVSRSLAGAQTLTMQDREGLEAEEALRGQGRGRS